VDANNSKLLLLINTFTRYRFVVRLSLSQNIDFVAKKLSSVVKNTSRLQHPIKETKQNTKNKGSDNDKN